MPGTMAKWGKKRWKITAKKINPINEMSYSMNYNTDEGKKEKRTLTIPYDVYREFGVNIQVEINDWYRYLGCSAPLYLGKKRFGPRKLKLTGVSVSEIRVTDTGTVRSASIELDFAEA